MIHYMYVRRTCVVAVADLGMFSMFGRTGAFTKRGPHKRSGIFCMPEIMGGDTIRVNE